MVLALYNLVLRFCRAFYVGAGRLTLPRVADSEFYIDDDEFTILVHLIDIIKSFGDEIFLFDSLLEKKLLGAPVRPVDVNLFGRDVVIEVTESSTVLAHHMVQLEDKLASVVLFARDFIRLLPVLFSVRSLSRPSVFSISFAPIDNIFDLSSMMSIKDLAIGTIFSDFSIQEIQDISILINILANNLQRPMMHCFGAIQNKAQPSTVNLETLKSFLKSKEPSEEPENPEQSTNLYLRTTPKDENAFQAITEEVEKLFDQFSAVTQRRYRLFEEYGNPKAKIVVVILLTNRQELQRVLQELSKSGKEIRAVVVRLYRPWSSKHFLATLNDNVKHIAVLEQTQTQAGSASFAPLFQDVVSSIICKSSSYSDVSVTFHTYGAYNVTNEYLSSLYNNYEAGLLKNETILPVSTSNPENNQIVTSKNVRFASDLSSKAIEQYYKVLQQVLGAKQIEIFAPVLDESINTPEGVTKATSAEFAFGLYLNREQKRAKLVQWAKEILESSLLPESFKEALQSWYHTYEDTEKSIKTSEQLQIAIETLSEENLNEIDFLVKSQDVLVAKSYWIIGSEEWAYDIMASGVHGILKANKNINLLVVNTSLLDKTSGARRKDIGLFAMNYGGCFVAGIAAYGSYSQMVRVVHEANEFTGPAIVLAYSPVLESNENISYNNPELFSLTETKKAVDNGLWPLYRYNPRKQSSVAFELDSSKIKNDIENFLKRENQLTIMSDSNAKFNFLFSGNLTSEVNNKHANLLSTYQDLLSKMQTPDRSLIVLYGSDGGNAEEAAQRLAADASIMKYASRCMSMNDIQWEQLVEEETLILFVVATAGQGEFPSNCKDAWKLIEDTGAPSSLFQQSKYAVFALGDSHYWPKPEEKVFYCKPGRDLDLRVSELGGERIIELGLGDDQDEDGWQTKFEIWRNSLWEALGCDSSLLPGAKPKVTPDDDIKSQSNFLRGTIAEGLTDRSTLALSYENTKLTKFHGIYQQDDRDLREQRRQQGQEKAFSFMVRIRAPAGVCTPAQWQMVDKLASSHGNDTFKLTTRQAVQLHGILKFNLKESIQIINRELMDTLAACGDVNRNVMCNPNPAQSNIFEEIHEIANKLSEYLTPRTSAYHEIWLDKKQVAGAEIGDIEPIYGPNYLPRKFKIAIAVPPHNDVDVLAHCLGFIAIIENEKLVGFNVSIGGGMGMTHNNLKTFPRLADLLGFCTPEQTVEISEAVLLVQRDFGDRVNRKHARLKYTLEDHGMPWFRAQVEDRLGWKLQEPRDYKFKSNGDRYGWVKGSNSWHFTLWVENGRVRDVPGYLLRTALLELSQFHTGDFRITANQNLIIANVTDEQKPKVQALFDKYHINNDQYSGLRLNSVACVALPTCGLALAESERYLPVLISKIDDVLDRVGLRQDAITIRMSGCPNGCSRPYVAEIALVGRAPGIYNLYLGGGFSAERLCKLYKDSVNEDQIIEALTPLLERYAAERNENEKFGDFVIRSKVVKETLSGNTFHDK